MISGLQAASIYQNLNRFPASGGLPATGGRVSVPVQPLFAPNLVFKHVIGVPAGSAEEATPPFKVLSLENFIGYMIRTDKSSAAEAPAESGAGRASQKTIASIGERFHRVEASLRPFSTGLAPSPGTFVNRLA